MKEIKTKMKEMLEAKLADGTNFKAEMSGVLGESNLAESVQSNFIDVSEALIIKFGSELATELVESVELDLTNQIVEMEQNTENYTSYVNEKMETAQEQYSEYLSEKAEAYVDYVDTGLERFTEEIDAKAAEYCEYVNENMNALVEERMVETQNKLDKYIDYVAESYVTENELAIETSIKEDLLDSLIGDLRVVFEKHSLDLPKEINVVEELEEDLTTSEETIDKLVEKVNSLKAELQEANRSIEFDKSTKGLTESQRERVSGIVSKLSLSESEYSDKLGSICEMVSGAESFVQADIITDNGSQDYQIINEDNQQNLEVKNNDINMQAYIAAAQNFAK